MGKNTGFLVLFALSAVLCGCGEKTLSYRMADFSRKEPGCDTLSGEMCATVNLRYPVFSGGNEAAAEAANETIAGIVFGEMRTADSLCGVFFGQWEKFNSENKPDTHPAEDEKESDHQEDAGYVSPWYYAASIDVKGEYRGCLSLAHTVSTNAFFARKPFIRKYFVLNGKSGILLSPADVFSDTLAVRKVVTAVFREKSGVSRGIPLAEQGIGLGADGLLPLADDFAVSAQGVVFRYDMDAIAPNLQPENEIFIPYDIIEPLLEI